MARSTLGWPSRLARKDAPVIAAMRELATRYRRYGYRRIQVLLERRSLEMGADRVHRLWRQERLQVPWCRMSSHRQTQDKKVARKAAMKGLYWIIERT